MQRLLFLLLLTPFTVTSQIHLTFTIYFTNLEIPLQVKY